MQQSDWRWLSINEGDLPSRHSGMLMTLARILISLIVCLSSIVAVVTMLTVLLLHPLSQVPPLTTQPQPANSSSCPSHPRTSTVYLPQLCTIYFPNGTSTMASSYQTASCTQCLCTTDEGSCATGSGRCCCKDITTTNISYSCPNYFDGNQIHVGNIATQCGCVPCGDFKVSFIVQIVDSLDGPISLANVTVDLKQTYLTDDTGHVGFLVPASHTMVQLDIRAACYAEYSQSYFIIPGQINTLRVVLTETKTLTVFPPEGPFLLHPLTLTILPLSHGSLFVNLVRSDLPLLPFTDGTIDTYLYFPGGVFPVGRLYTFLASDRQLDSDQDLEQLHFSFSSLSNDEHMLVYAYAMGNIEILNDEGLPFVPKLDKSTNTTDLFGVLVVTQTNLSSSNERTSLYILNNSTGSLLESSLSIILESNSSTPYTIVLSLPDGSQWPSPLYYIIGTKELERCYLALNINDPMKILHDNSITNTVIINRMQSTINGITSTYVAVGHTDGCMAVPCQGDAVIKLLGNDVAMDHYIDNIERSDHVYNNITECVSTGLKDDTTTSGYVALDLVSSYCDVPYPFHSPLIAHTSPPTPSQMGMSNNDSLQFCSVRVAIATCMGKSTKVVTTYLSEIQVVHLSSLNEDGYIVTEGGSGSGMSDMDYVNEADPCNNVHYLCQSFPCGVNVSIKVSQTSDEITLYEESCIGHSDNMDTNSVVLENIGDGTEVFVFQSIGIEVGVQSSEFTEDVAISECNESNDVGVHFQCYLP